MIVFRLMTSEIHILFICLINKLLTEKVLCSTMTETDVQL